MPPTKMRLGISVPYFGAARGVSSPPPGVAVGGGAAAILCISAGVVSRRKLGAPKGRILRLFLEFGGARWPKKLLVAAVRWIERLRCFAICFLFGYGGGCCFRSAQIESDRIGLDDGYATAGAIEMSFTDLLVARMYTVGCTSS